MKPAQEHLEHFVQNNHLITDQLWGKTGSPFLQGPNEQKQHKWKVLKRVLTNIIIIRIIIRIIIIIKLIYCCIVILLVQCSLFMYAHCLTVAVENTRWFIFSPNDMTRSYSRSVIVVDCVIDAMCLNPALNVQCYTVAALLHSQSQI